MYTKNTRLHFPLLDCKLYDPWSQIDGAETQEAAVLFTYEPESAQPGLSVTLSVRLELEKFGTGHRMVVAFSLAGRDQMDMTKFGGGIMLGTDVPIDSSIVEEALATGNNPILQILIKQDQLAADFCAPSPRLASIVNAETLRANTPVPLPNDESNDEPTIRL